MSATWGNCLIRKRIFIIYGSQEGNLVIQKRINHQLQINTVTRLVITLRFNTTSDWFIFLAHSFTQQGEHQLDYVKKLSVKKMSSFRKSGSDSLQWHTLSFNNCALSDIVSTPTLPLHSTGGYQFFVQWWWNFLKIEAWMCHHSWTWRICHTANRPCATLKVLVSIPLIPSDLTLWRRGIQGCSEF